MVELRLLALIGNLAFFAAQHLETGFLPEMDEGSIVLDYTSPPGTSLEETDRMLREAEKTFAAVPEIQGYSRRTGTQMGFFITEPNYGDYLIQLRKDRSAAPRKRSMTSAIASRSRSLRCASTSGRRIGDMLGDLMSSVQPIEIESSATTSTSCRPWEKGGSRRGKVSGTAGRLRWHRDRRTFRGHPHGRSGIGTSRTHTAGTQRPAYHATARHQRGAGLRTGTGDTGAHGPSTPPLLRQRSEQARVFLPGGALVSASQVARSA
ncbi:MAG: efflux RND transporter permease subunit [Flavobacteriales bacterium]|nr:efflux RND transporter permease subunit [Flavobacteriales bacterium]